MQQQLFGAPPVGGWSAPLNTLPSLRRETEQRAVSEPEDAEAREEQDRRRRDYAMAALQPTKSTALLAQSERSIEASSRTFSRMESRATAAEQTRAGHHNFKKALAEASAPAPQQAARPASTKPSVAPPSPPGDKAPTTMSTAGAPPAPPAATPAAPPTSASGAGAPAMSPSLPATVTPPPLHAAPEPSPLGAGALAAAATATSARVQNAAPMAASAIPASAPVSGPASQSQGSSPREGLRGVMEAASERPGAATRARGKQPASAADPAERAESIERIVRLVQRRLDRERSITVLRVDPPELGMLKLHMDLRKDSLELRIDAHSEMAHRLLREDLDALRAGLEAAGIRVERIEVRAIEPPNGQDAQAFASFAGDSDGSGGGQGRFAESDDTEQRGEPAAQSREPVAEPLVNIIA